MISRQISFSTIFKVALVMSFSFLFCANLFTLPIQANQQMFKPDPPGDQEGPNYLDVLSVELNRIGDELIFEFTTAAIIPDSPDHPYTAYIFRIDPGVGGSFKSKYHVRIFNGRHTNGWKGTVDIRYGSGNPQVLDTRVSGKTGRIVVKVPELSSPAKFEWLLNTFAGPDHGRIRGDRIPGRGNYVFLVSVNQEVKFRGTITSFSENDSIPKFTVQIEKVFLGSLSPGVSILVEWFAPVALCSSGAAPMNDVRQGDEVEVFGVLTGSGVKVTCSPHYIKKIAQNSQGQIIKEVKDNKGNKIGLTIKIKYPTHLEVGEKGKIIVELLTRDAKEATWPDHEHNIQPGTIKLGSDESFRKEGGAKLWIDPTEGGTLKPYNRYYRYEDLVLEDKTNSLILETEIEILKVLPLSGTFLGAYDILKGAPSIMEEAANYDIGTLPSSEILTNENDYDQWVYGWTFNYYETACVSGNRVKLSLPFSYEEVGKHPIGVYINVKFEEKSPIIAPGIEPLKLAYEDEFGITVS